MVVLLSRAGTGFQFTLFWFLELSSCFFDCCYSYCCYWNQNPANVSVREFSQHSSTGNSFIRSSSSFFDVTKQWKRWLFHTSWRQFLNKKKCNTEKKAQFLHFCEVSELSIDVPKRIFQVKTIGFLIRAVFSQSVVHTAPEIYHIACQSLGLLTFNWNSEVKTYLIWSLRCLLARLCSRLRLY